MDRFERGSVSILTRQSTDAAKTLLSPLQVIREIWRRRASYDIVYFLMQGLHLAAGLPTARLLRKAVVVKISGSGTFPLLKQSKAGRLELHWMRRWRIPVMGAEQLPQQPLCFVELRGDIEQHPL